MKKCITTLILFSISLFHINAITLNKLPIGSEHHEKILIELYNRAEISLDFKDIPMVRSMSLANEGITDGEIVRTKLILEKYSNLMPVPTPIIIMKIHAFVINNDIVIETLDDLRKYKVGIVRGVVASEKLTKELNVVGAKDVETLVRILKHGRIDIAISPDITTRKIISSFNYTEIVRIDPPLLEIPLYHMLNKKHKDLIPVLDYHLNQMIDDGTITTILSEFISNN